jgi:hypothetical protein
VYIASLVLFLYNIEINYTGKSNKTEEKSSMAEEEFQEQSSVKTETEKEQSAVEKKKAKEQSATEKENVNVENVMEQEQVEDPVIIESEDVKMETEPDYTQMEVKNPRIGKVLKLEEEAKRQNELEQLRSKRIRQQQEYINRMIDSVEANLKNTKEEQKLNEEFERHIRTEVYRMHGISEDKLQGMEERRNAWYQGAAFALFFLSLILVAVCGVLHGFGSELCIFMAFYTAIEGTLLSNGRKQAAFLSLAISGKCSFLTDFLRAISPLKCPLKGKGRVLGTRDIFKTF